MRGKDHPHVHLMIAVKDHPRVCGEKMLIKGKRGYDMGSPPRMRGKVGAEATPEPFIGITPAYAGKRYVAGDTLKSFRDHPRVCGEK